MYFGLLFAVIAIHEAGHAIAVLSFGLRLRTIAVWGIGYNFQTRRFGPQVHGQGHRIDGFVQYDALNLPVKAYQRGWIASAGPAANFFSAVVVSILYPIDSDAYRSLNEFAFLSLLAAAINLVPFRASDGRQILDVIKGRGRRAAAKASKLPQGHSTANTDGNGSE